MAAEWGLMKRVEQDCSVPHPPSTMPREVCNFRPPGRIYLPNHAATVFTHIVSLSFDLLAD